MLAKPLSILIITCFLGLLTHNVQSDAAEKENYLDRPAVQAFIEDITQQYPLIKRSVVEPLLQEARKDPIVLKYIQKPAERLEWKQYEALLIKPNRVVEGILFWKKNADILREAEKRYGVPAKIIVAILGIETSYGHNTGHHRILDALTTLSFDYAPRSAFFKKELSHFLMLAQELKTVNPLTLKGSYAGAMGIPQFMPSSYRHFAVDSDNKGYSNLIDNVKDTVFSVGHYLQKNGWVRNNPAVLPAYSSGNKTASRILNTLIDNETPQTLEEWTQHNIHINASIKKSVSPTLRLIKLQGQHGFQYWFTLQNFSVIKTYNRSTLYSMAVYKLSELLEDGYNTST